MELKGKEVLTSGCWRWPCTVLLRHPGWPWLSILCLQLLQEPDPQAMWQLPQPVSSCSSTSIGGFAEVPR